MRCKSVTDKSQMNVNHLPIFCSGREALQYFFSIWVSRTPTKNSASSHDYQPFTDSTVGNSFGSKLNWFYCFLHVFWFRLRHAIEFFPHFQLTRRRLAQNNGPFDRHSEKFRQTIESQQLQLQPILNQLLPELGKRMTSCLCWPNGFCLTQHHFSSFSLFKCLRFR